MSRTTTFLFVETSTIYTSQILRSEMDDVSFVDVREGVDEKRQHFVNNVHRSFRENAKSYDWIFSST